MLNAPYGWEVWANNKAKNVISNDWTANKELYKFTSQGSHIPTISPADCFRSHDDNRQTHKNNKTFFDSTAARKHNNYEFHNNRVWNRF